MRTTVTLDTDVQALLKKAMRKGEISFKQALNDAVRGALAPARSVQKREPFTLPVYHLGRPLVDLTKANALAGDLEDMELIAKMRAGR